MHALCVQLPNHRFSFAMAPLILVVSVLNAQSLSPTPGFLQDVAAQFPINTDFSLEQQIQIGTQGNPADGNPLAYGHALQFRPWLHYDGIRNTTLTAGVSYIIYFNVPGTSYYKHPEWRDTIMATIKQPVHSASLYEQLRWELLNFHDSHGVVQHLPRMRIRSLAKTSIFRKVVINSANHIRVCIRKPYCSSQEHRTPL
jgi:hypothetical protein